MIVFVAGSGLREVCGDQEALGLTFIREVRSAPLYRLYSIDDRYAALVEVGQGGVSVEGELCELAEDRAAALLAEEPAGVGQGEIALDGGGSAPGPVATPETLPPGARDISIHGGFAAYLRSRGASRS
jgi:hypothetical protein